MCVCLCLSARVPMPAYLQKWRRQVSLRHKISRASMARGSNGSPQARGRGPGNGGLSCSALTTVHWRVFTTTKSVLEFWKTVGWHRTRPGASYYPQHHSHCLVRYIMTSSIHFNNCTWEICIYFTVETKLRLVTTFAFRLVWNNKCFGIFFF